MLTLQMLVIQIQKMMIHVRLRSSDYIMQYVLNDLLSLRSLSVDYQRFLAEISTSNSSTVAQVHMCKLANESDGGLTFNGTKTLNDMASWHEILERCSTRSQSSTFDMIVASTCANTTEDFPQQNSVANILNGGLLDAKEDSTAILDKPLWQVHHNFVHFMRELLLREHILLGFSSNLMRFFKS